MFSPSLGQYVSLSCVVIGRGQDRFIRELENRESVKEVSYSQGTVYRFPPDMRCSMPSLFPGVILNVFTSGLITHDSTDTFADKLKGIL